MKKEREKESKADRVRDALLEIAQSRLWGMTWPIIAKEYPHLEVSADELRSYWGRFTGGQHPAAVLLADAKKRITEVDAQIAQAVARARLEADQEVEKRIAAARSQAAAEIVAAASRARLEADEEVEKRIAVVRSQTAAEIAEAAGEEVEKRVVAVRSQAAAEIAEAVRRAQEADEEVEKRVAAVRSQAAAEIAEAVRKTQEAERRAATTRRVADEEIARAVAKTRFALDEARQYASMAALSAARKADLDRWIEFGLQLARAHRSNAADVQRLLENLVVWAEKQK